MTNGFSEEAVEALDQAAWNAAILGARDLTEDQAAALDLVIEQIERARIALGGQS